MKNSKQWPMARFLQMARFSMPFSISIMFWWLAIAALTAQDTGAPPTNATAKPTARNAWEDIYLRVEGSIPTPILLELLKSMELEKDQEGLASSYALILKDQIYVYPIRYEEDPVYAEKIFSILLDKIAEHGEIVAKENPEIINTIALSLIPDLGYGAILGKANYALGRLGAKDYSQNIIKTLEDINSIMALGANNDFFKLNYAAAGCIEALIELKPPASFPVLFQVKYGSFSQIVRNRATYLMELLEQEAAENVKENVVEFIRDQPKLSELHTMIKSVYNREFSFNPETVRQINLALLTRLNGSLFANNNPNMENEVIRRTIANIVEQGAEGIEAEASEQLKQSYLDTSNIDIKLSALEAIGKLRSMEGIKFLQGEVARLNILQHSVSIGPQDQRILRQLLYSLLISKDSSEQTVSVLRTVSITPYSSAIRNIALDILKNIS